MSSSLPVIILGAGGHSKVVIDALLASKREILGIAAPNRQVGDQVLGVKVIGGDAKVLEFPHSSVELVNGIGAMPDSESRWKLASIFRNRGYRFSTVIHPHAILGEGVVLAEGVQVMAGAIIQPDCSIGKDTIINTGVVVDHDCKIAQRCHLAPGTIINGGVKIGVQVFIGSSSCVTQLVTIHDFSIIAAGSIIYRDVPAGMKIIQKRDSSRMVIKRE